MVKEEHINKACLSNDMKKLKVGVKPTWISRDNTEGIEFNGYTVVAFKNDNGVRLYNDERISDKIKNLANSLNNIPNEDEPVKDTGTIDTDNALLPDFLTPALISNWAKMSTTDRILLFQKTPKDKVKQVAVGKNDKGIIEYAPYVEGNYMFKEANAAFLFDWYIDIYEVEKSVTGVCVRGRLFCWFTEYNKYLSRPATGYQELNKKIDSQLAVKGATTDAIKKGLSLFGFNSDVYSGDV